MSNPMVPSPNWGEVAQGFSEAQGRQVFLCATCVWGSDDDYLTPPAQLVTFRGTTYCLRHYQEGNYIG